MIKLDRIYTRGGDEGKTSLGDGSRVSKDHPRIAALSAVEEANSVLGVARLHTGDSPLDHILARVQNELFDLGADLATPPAEGESRLRLTDAYVAALERDIDAMSARQAPLTSFVLPGGTPAAAHLHLARTVVRRAELAVVSAIEQGEDIGSPVLRYLNRLSDLLFVLARAYNEDEALWLPGGE